MATRGVNSSGVKQLLDAEKRAAERVEEARRSTSRSFFFFLFLFFPSSSVSLCPLCTSHVDITAHTRAHTHLYTHACSSSVHREVERALSCAFLFIPSISFASPIILFLALKWSRFARSSVLKSTVAAANGVCVSLFLSRECAILFRFPCSPPFSLPAALFWHSAARPFREDTADITTFAPALSSVLSRQGGRQATSPPPFLRSTFGGLSLSLSLLVPRLGLPVRPSAPCRSCRLRAPPPLSLPLSCCSLGPCAGCASCLLSPCVPRRVPQRRSRR